MHRHIKLRIGDPHRFLKNKATINNKIAPNRIKHAK